MRPIVFPYTFHAIKLSHRSIIMLTPNKRSLSHTNIRISMSTAGKLITTKSFSSNSCQYHTKQQKNFLF